MTLKDQLFSKDKVLELAVQIQQAYPDFDTNTFVRDCVQAFAPLELKDRMNHVADMLERHLTEDFETNISYLSMVMKQVDQPQFIYGAIQRYLECHGTTDRYIDLALEKLGEFTRAFTGEFAIRSFLNLYPEKTMSKVMEWARSENVDKRRLASEGTRPKLPWAGKIELDYRRTESVLDVLFDDPERYVTRSVANHLNDISKIDPFYVIDKLKQWRATYSNKNQEMDYIDHHSLRTLLKQGHPEALDYMGFSSDPSMKRIEFKLKNDTISIGDTLEYSLTIESSETGKLMIDIIIDYPTKHGKRTSKVYKWKSISIEAGKPVTFHGRRSFKHLSTRTMRPGYHEIAVQINGTVWKTTPFTLSE